MSTRPTKPFSYCRHELSLQNLDRHEPPCQCTTQTQTHPLSSHTTIKSQHAIPVVHLAACMTVPQWYSGSVHTTCYRNTRLISTTHCQTFLSKIKLILQKKWTKHYVIKVLPTKHSQNQRELSHGYSYMRWDKRHCCLKMKQLRFAWGVNCGDYKVQDSGWENRAVFNLANLLNCLLI